MEREELVKTIKTVLPSLEDNVLEGVITTLIECGVESADDLQYVREADLNQVLRPIQARRLLDTWKGRCQKAA